MRVGAKMGPMCCSREFILGWRVFRRWETNLRKVAGCRVTRVLTLTPLFGPEECARITCSTLMCAYFLRRYIVFRVLCIVMQFNDWRNKRVVEGKQNTFTVLTGNAWEKCVRIKWRRHSYPCLEWLNVGTLVWVATFSAKFTVRGR